MNRRFASFSLSFLIHLSLLLPFMLMSRLVPYKEEKVLEIDLSVFNIPKVESLSAPEKAKFKSPDSVKRVKEQRVKRQEETPLVRKEPPKEEIPRTAQTPKALQETPQSTSVAEEGKEESKGRALPSPEAPSQGKNATAPQEESAKTSQDQTENENLPNSSSILQ